jgi:hypothetical protein
MPRKPTANLTWFACCGPAQAALLTGWGYRRSPAASLGETMAWVLDTYPEERTRHAQELRQMGVLVGEFPTEDEAFAAAKAALMGE